VVEEIQSILLQINAHHCTTAQSITLRVLLNCICCSTFGSPDVLVIVA
jgi:hypothetical protein